MPNEELFESLGNVSSGVAAIFKPHELADAEHARERELIRGAIEFDDVQFRYTEGATVFRGLSLSIPAGPAKSG